jgi:hypothetical protein
VVDGVAASATEEKPYVVIATPKGNPANCFGFSDPNFLYRVTVEFTKKKRYIDQELLSFFQLSYSNWNLFLIHNEILHLVATWIFLLWMFVSIVKIVLFTSCR